MIIQRFTDKITIAAPAKVNLFLEVLGKRNDGYHEVQTVLCPISLFDRLEFTPIDGGHVDLRMRFPNQRPPLPKDSILLWLRLIPPGKYLPMIAIWSLEP